VLSEFFFFFFLASGSEQAPSRRRSNSARHKQYTQVKSAGSSLRHGKIRTYPESEVVSCHIDRMKVVCIMDGRQLVPTREMCVKQQLQYLVNCPPTYPSLVSWPILPTPSSLLKIPFGILGNLVRDILHSFLSGFDVVRVRYTAREPSNDIVHRVILNAIDGQS